MDANHDSEVWTTSELLFCLGIVPFMHIVFMVCSGSTEAILQRVHPTGHENGNIVAPKANNARVLRGLVTTQYPSVPFVFVFMIVVVLYCTTTTRNDWEPLETSPSHCADIVLGWSKEAANPLRQKC